DGLAAVDKRDHHDEPGAAVHEIVRAVERIDDPAPFGGGDGGAGLALAAAALLADDCAFGQQRAALFRQDRLAVEVGLGDAIGGAALLADIARVERLEAGEYGAGGGRDHDVAHRGGVDRKRCGGGAQWRTAPVARAGSAPLSRSPSRMPLRARKRARSATSSRTVRCAYSSSSRRPTTSP